MREALVRGRSPAFAGLVTALAVIAIAAAAPHSLRHMASAQAEDMLLRFVAGSVPSLDAPPLVVVEIDAATLARVGPWPWPRAHLAELVDTITRAAPRLLVVDLLLEGTDPRSPLDELRRRGFAADDPAIVDLEQRLADDDATLRSAFTGANVVLGLALDPARRGEAETVPILTTGQIVLDGLWRGAGVVSPAKVAPPGAGLGVLSLAADPDGAIRRAPLLVEAGGKLYPSLALEAARMLRQSSAYVLSPEPRSIAAGPVAVRLAPDGLLRLMPGSFAEEPFTRVSAAALLAGAPAPLAGAVVLLGATAPEAGGLRATAEDPLTASVVIQARALWQILAGRSTVPPLAPRTTQALLVAASATVGIALAALLAPVLATFVFATALVLYGAGLAALLVGAGILVDPAPVVAVGSAAFAATLIAAFARARREAARIRRRFEQHLSPEVVGMIARDPLMLKLRGERRTITVLFTDIEGFTSLTERAEPEILVALLDTYFEGVVSRVLAHGGTVDKIVGDAVHAFFNAPLNTPNHVEAAIACAEAVIAWSNDFREAGIAHELGLGRTRIGIEAGQAIVGDVGVRAKLDYTAHGYPVNAAARLEAANKLFGSQICVGPGAARLTEPGRLLPLGRVHLRGLAGEAEVFSPVP